MLPRIRFRIFLLLAFVAALTANSASATQPSFRFLQLGVGSKELGMGGAATAASADVYSLHWNPAGLAFLPEAQMGFSHSQWLLGSQYSFAAGAVPLKAGAIALGGLFLQYPEQDGRGENREKLGGFSASDSALSIGYGRPITSAFTGGATLKIIQSRIGTDEARGVAVDLGVRQKVGSRLGLGLGVQNLGRARGFVERDEALPTAYSLGAAYRLPAGFGAAIDWKIDPAEGRHEVVFGSEIAVGSALSLRAGYLAALGEDQGIQSLSGSSGVTAGLGFRLLRYDFDYAFTPFASLGDAHRLSILARFR
ncbi:MAG: PorV/PorQ family protein [Elusimicrobia bacterium]|nr:PorV/PorQ family protein [Candidatus Obscuribacterium magneticum]